MKVGFIGAGNMASAMIGGIINSKLLSPSNIIASAKTDKTLDNIKEKYKINTTKDSISLVKECDDIKQELEISKRRRPMWDEKFLQEIGFESCKIDCEISGRVYKIKDDFYNPTPMFKVCAIKSR